VVLTVAVDPETIPPANAPINPISLLTVAD